MILPPLRRRSLLAALAVSAAVAAAHAQDFGPPGQRTFVDPLNPAVEVVRDLHFTAAFIDTPSGLGVMASGDAAYQPSPNRNMTLLKQRLAFQRALLAAKRNMLEMLNGASAEARNALIAGTDSHESDLLSVVNSDLAMDERLRSVAEGVLAGVVVLSMDDHPDEGRVRVKIASSPRTQGVRRTTSSDVAYTDSMDVARSIIIDEISRNVTPPEGGRVLTDPFTGQTAWIGFGSALVRHNDHPRVATRNRRAAEQQARLRAQRSLIAMLRGERIEAAAEADESFVDVTQQFDRLADETGRGGVRRLAQDAELSAVEFAEEEFIELTVNDRLPPGAEQLAGVSASGDWVYHAYLFSKVRDRRAPAAAPPAPEPTRRPEPPQWTPVGAADDCAAPIAPHRDVALGVGRGDTVEIATLRALRDAVMQINGAALNSNQRYRSEFEHHMTDDADDVRAFDHLQDDIDSETGGFVARFERKSKDRVDDGWRVAVCAEVPKWKEGWRPGKPTIAVVPPVGPGLQGHPQAPAIRNAFTAEANNLLIQRRAFRVIDRTDIGAARRELDLIENAVAQGDMQPIELIKLGHALGADYLIVSVINRDDHWFEQHPIPGVGNRVEQRERLEVNMSIRILNVATNEIVAEETFARQFGGADLDRIAREHGAAGDPHLLGPRIAAREVLVPRAMDVFCRSGWGAELTVRHREGDLVFLTGGGPCLNLAPGHEIVVRQPIPGHAGGMHVGTLRVTDAGPDGSFTARVHEGRADQIEVGMRCAPR